MLFVPNANIDSRFDNGKFYITNLGDSRAYLVARERGEGEEE